MRSSWRCAGERERERERWHFALLGVLSRTGVKGCSHHVNIEDFAYSFLNLGLQMFVIRRSPPTYILTTFFAFLCD